MKALITGVGGYIGSMLSRHLKKFNIVDEIFGFDNFLYNQGPYVYDAITRRCSCTLYQEDLLSFSDNLRDCIQQSDVIIPLAAIVGAPICDKMPEYATGINYKWYERLLAEPNIEKKLIIYPNTNSGYGATGTGICTEETPCNPISLYGQTKKDTEDLLLNNHPNSICFRLATVFGWSYRPRLDLLINNLAYNAKFSGHIELFDGHFRRNYIHVKDICRAFVFALHEKEQMKGNVYNLGNDDANATKKELVELICNYSGASYNEVQNRTDPDKRDYIVSSQKLYDIGYKAIMSLDDGIKEMLNFFTYLSSDEDIRDTQTSYMFNYK